MESYADCAVSALVGAQDGKSAADERSRKHEKALVSPEVKVVRMHTKSGDKLMKKMNRAISVVLIVLAVIAGFTCKPYVGLGAQIDINPPSGTISYPEMGETPIRGSFVLKGTASDDDGIESVSVVFKNIDTKKTIEIGEAGGFTKGYANVSWTLNVQNESTGNKTKKGIEHKLVKDYRIPDGEYEVIVTVTDTGSKKSSFTKLYKIDNTPPVLILDRPSTATTSSSIQPDSYGSVFTVKGAAKDRYAIEDLTFKVPAANISVSKRFVGENISEEIAVATKNGAGFTDPLYKYSDDNGNSPIHAQLFLTDNARSFKDDGDPGLGNTSNWYYVRDDQIRSVLADGYTVDVISDYFAGKEGDASSSDFPKRLLAKLYTAEGESIRTKLENARVMTEGGDQRYSIFTLNPNKSPGFSVTNGTNFLSSYPVSTPNASLPLGTTAYFSDALPPQVYLKLVRNKDNTPLVQTPDYNGYRASPIVINMYKCTSEPKYVTYGDKKLLEVDRATVPAYSLKFANLTAEDETKGVVSGANELTVKWQLPNQAAFSAGYYMIQVEGTDTASNEFVAYDDDNKPSGGVFIIKYELAGQNLRISPSSPSGFVKENFNVSASVFSPGMVSEVRYKIVTNVEANASATAGASDTLLTNSSGNTWKTATSVQISTIGNEGAYKALFWAKDNAGNTTTASMPFVKDTKAPVPKITYPKSNNIVAGTVPIQGTLDDKPATGINDYANVKLDGTKYIIGKQTTEPTAATTSGWRVMDEPGVALWKFTYDLDTLTAGDAVAVNGSIYDIPIYILTEDNAGNKAVAKLIIKYDSEGDKPIVTVSNPRQGQSTGGTILIHGTAASRLGGYNDAGKVYIQFSKDGNFTNTANGNMTFGTTGGGYDADWDKGGNGQLVPGTDTAGGASWQMSINGNGEFNNPNGDSWKVYFRLRAENKDNHKLGVWSEPIKIFIDKTNPTIGSPDPLKVGTDIYAPDMWIKDGKTLTGSLFDDSGIKEVEISSPELLGNKQYTLEEAKNKGWIVEDTAHAPTSAPSAAIKNYKLQIPLTLEGASSLLSEEARIKGKITLKIKIVEGASKNLATEETLSFKFDVTKPAGGLGRYIYRYNGNFAVSSVVNSDLAEQVKQAAGTSADYSKLRLLISNTLVKGKAVKVTGVSGNTIQFAPALSKAGIYNCMLYEEPYIIRNESGKWIVRGVASDSGSGIKKITAKVTVGTVTKPIDITGQSGIEQYTGGQVSWVGEIDLSDLNDGKGELTCTISDEQGNEYTVPAVDIVVKNKPIAVSDITLKTKIGDKAFETVTGEDGADDDPKAKLTKKTDKTTLDQTVTMVSSNFAFKSKTDSKIKVSFTGGEGTVKYRLKRSDGHELEGLTDITSGTEIDLKNYLASIGNSALDPVTGTLTPTTIVLELWDQAAGFTQGIDSASAKIDITTLFETIDNTEPTVVMLPFHWNGETDNSLYGNSRANGHVEIKNSGNSQVSGKVTLRGFAYDNIKIDSITATLPFSTPVTVTASAAADTGTSIATMDANGAELKVTRSDVNYSGYYVKWELSFDSSKITMGAAKDITVVANDGTNTSVGNSTAVSSDSLISGAVSRSGKKSATITGNGLDLAKIGQFVVFQTGDKQYLTRIAKKNKNTAEGKTTITLDDEVPTDMTDVVVYKAAANKTKVAVNSVPYITKIETSIKKMLGKDFMRTATGAYTVRAKTSASPEYETVTVTGFNLKPTNLSGSDSDIRLSKSETGGDIGSNGKITAKKGTGLTASMVTSGDDSKWNVTIGAAGNGYLTFIVNDIPSINNINNNEADYNKETSPVLEKADDDCKIELWDFKRLSENSAAPNAKNAVYPSMVMKGNTPQFAYVNNAQGYGLAKFWDGSSEIKIYENWDLFTFSSLALNGSGSRAVLFDINVVNSGNGNASDSGGIMTNFFYNPPDTTWTGTTYYFRSYNVWMDGLYKQNGFKAVLDRYQYPCIKMVGTDALSHVFYSTYDAVDDRIVFRYFKVGTDKNKVGNGVAANAQEIHKSDETSKLYINKQELNQVTYNTDNWPTYNDININNKRFDPYGTKSGTTTQPQAFATGAGNGIYSAVAGVPVDATGAPVTTTAGSVVDRARGIVVYYSASSLCYIYATNDENNAWSAPVVLDTNCGGDYVSMVVDKDNHVHIAYQDSFNGDVKYIYIPTYKDPATRKAVKVDSYLTVGGKLTLTVHDNTPYIAYKGLGNFAKVAWYKANSGVPAVDTLVAGVNDKEQFTGKWEAQIIPTSIVDSDSNRFNIGVGTDGRPVIGYSNNQSGNKGIEYLTRMPDLMD